MAKLGKGMAAPIEQGHYEPTNVPKLKKGEFQHVGTYINAMDSVDPKGVSVNVKTNNLQLGENQK